MYINLDSCSVDIDLVSWTFLCKLVVSSSGPTSGPPDVVSTLKLFLIISVKFLPCKNPIFIAVVIQILLARE